MANPRTKARLEARILERAAYCLQFEVRDPRAGFVTLTRVELTNDLSLAKVFYSVLGDEGERSRVAHMLQSAAGFVQRQVARVLEMRRVPHLRFVYDETLERARHLEDVIREARARDRAINPHVDDADPEAEAPEGAGEDELDGEL